MEIKCKERLAEATARAKALGDHTLARCLSHLRQMEVNMGGLLTLADDFAPLSFYWFIRREGEVIYNGGIIFHGPHDGGGDGGAPTFSVSLDRSTAPRWSIHT